MLKINDAALGNDPNDASAIFQLFPDLHYWSKDALQKLFVGILEISIEMCKDMKGGKYTRSATGAKKRILNFKKMVGKENQIWVLTRIYNEILRSEGLNVLPGFVFINQKRNIPINFKEELIMAELKRSQLVAAAKELNKELGLDPAIDTKLKGEELRDIVTEAAKMIDPKTDEFSEKTQIVIDALTEVPETPETHETTEEDSEPLEGKDVADILAQTKKLKDLKALVEENDEFKKLRKGLDKYAGLQGPRELKPLMEKCLGIEPAEKKAPTEKKEKKAPVEKKSTAPIFVVKYARPLAIITAILSGETNKEKLIKQAVKFIETSNKVDDTKEVAYFFKKLSACLTTKGLAEETDTDLTCKNIK